MNFLGLFVLLICHFIAGRGLIALFKLQLRPLIMVCLSMICGVALASFLPFFLELLHIDITKSSVGGAMAVLTLLFMVPLFSTLKNFKLPELTKIKLPAIYELPFFVVFGFLMFLSVWRCYYYPPNARDMLSGPEVMAELALKEKHIINSLFKIDLQSTNNYLKPPFITSLQIIYKMFVQPIGQLWLSVLVINFLLIVFTLMKEKLHAVIAYIVMIYFFSMPEVFGYTYLMLFDYSNMIFFFFGFYFLARHLQNKQFNQLSFAIFMFSIATYIRTETIILVGMALPIMVVYYLKDKMFNNKAMIGMAGMLVFPFIVYFLCMNVFVKHYIPIHYDVSKDVNQNLGDVSYFFKRLSDIVSVLVFSDYGVLYYGRFIYLFLVILFADIVYCLATRKPLNREAVIALYAVGVVYVGLALIGYVLPLADLMHTTKRGMFKMFPLMLLYILNSPLLTRASAAIKNWEYGTPQQPKPTVRPAAAKAAANPAGGAGKKKI